jgi:hypothetical protein
MQSITETSTLLFLLQKRAYLLINGFKITKQTLLTYNSPLLFLINIITKTVNQNTQNRQNPQYFRICLIVNGKNCFKSFIHNLCVLLTKKKLNIN